MLFQILQFGLEYISSPRSRTQFSALPRTGSNCADLKSSPDLVVGFEILRESFLLRPLLGRFAHDFVVLTLLLV